MRWIASFVLGLSFAAPLPAATGQLAPGSILVDPRAWSAPPDTAARADAVLAAIAAGDADTAIARLFADDDPHRFEPTAARVVDALQASAPTSTVLRMLEALAQAPRRLYRRHEEGAGHWFVPMYDVPGRAASALRGFEQLRLRDELRDALQRQPLDTLTRTDSPAHVLAEAILLLDDKAAAALVPLALAHAAEVPGAAWGALAQRQPRPDVLRATVLHAAPVDALPLLQSLPPKLPAEVALDWLEHAFAQPQYASAAVLALGALAPRSAVAEQKLFALLGSPQHGASAAAALARDPRPDRVARIGKRLDASDDPLEIGHLALALRLEGSAQAQARLQQVLHDTRLPAKVRAELQR